MFVLILSTLSGCTWLMMKPDRSWPLQQEHLAQGDAALHRKDYDGAIASYRKALELRERYRRDSEKAGHHPSRAGEARTLGQLAEAYTRRRDHAEAAAYRRRALEIRESENGPKSLYVGDLLNDLGYDYRMQGRYDDALSSSDRAARIFEEEKQKPRQAIALNNIGHVYDAQGRLAEAEFFFRRALAMTEGAVGRNPTPEHPGFRQNLRHLRDYSDAVRKSGRADEANRLEARLASMNRMVDEYIASVRKAGPETKAARIEVWYRTGERE